MDDEDDVNCSFSFPTGKENQFKRPPRLNQS